MGEKLLKILGSNRITLPKEFCKKFDLKQGDFVKAFWNEEEGLRLVPGKVIFKITIKNGEMKG